MDTNKIEIIQKGENSLELIQSNFDTIPSIHKKYRNETRFVFRFFWSFVIFSLNVILDAGVTARNATPTYDIIHVTLFSFSDAFSAIPKHWFWFILCIPWKDTQCKA